MPIYALKTTVSQEKTVARMIEHRAKSKGYPIYAILVTDSLRGYIFVEGADQLTVEKATQNLRHIRTRAVRGQEVPIDELSNVLIPKPAIEGLDEGDLVEVIDGPFKGSRARIIRIDQSREKVTVELLGGGMAIPIELHGDFVRRIEKGSEKIFDI